MRATSVTGIAIAALLLAGCLGGTTANQAGAGDAGATGGPGSLGGIDYPKGVHPYPNGDEWPTDLTGPFKLKSITHAVVSSSGTMLDGSIWLPDVPEGTSLPVVLWSTPYFSQTIAAHDDPAVGDNSDIAESVPVNLLIEHGFAVALFSVRGTGNSEGCFEFFGPNEQKDQAVLVEWLARQPWSNGRVGMTGLSYHGTTPWEAAIQNPPSLKTIVVAGMVSDLYTFFHTPQGAAFTIGGPFFGLVTGLVSLAPPSGFLGGSGSSFRGVPSLPAGRVCPEVVQMLAGGNTGPFTDVRDPQFWGDRNLIMRFPEVTASVFLTHGFDDNHGSGHQQQENWAWQALAKAPKRQLEGQYGHMFPNFAPEEYRIPDWNESLIEWFDFWLKGIGDQPPGVGTIDYQDGTAAWHRSTAWPPAEARDEVLYFNAGKMDPNPPSSPQVFRSRPVDPNALLCPSASPSAEPEGLFFATAPSEQRILVAGNPVGWLPLTSDLPGGLVAIHLYKLAKDFSCGQGGPSGAELLSAGVANLRFHGGGYQGKDFPVNTKTGVRIDITDLAEVLEPGERFGFVVSYGDPGDRTGPPFTSKITLAADGGDAPQLVIPVIEGTFGGATPGVDYGVRPFLPPGVGGQSVRP